MQADLVAGQPRMSILLLGGFDQFSNSSLRFSPAKCLFIAALLVFCSFPSPGHCIADGQPGFQKLFHLVGIPGLRRDERVDLATNSDGLSFQTKKVKYQVPYARIHQVLLLRADRRYEGRTYAATLATYGIGSLFILKKHHVDTVVLDYVNERGGKMGIVIQMETSQGDQFKNLLNGRGVPIVEPEGISESLSK